MRGLHKLGQDDVPDELLSISVKHDLTIDERKREKELRAVVKEKNDTNQEKNIKFALMGPPWERHIGIMQKRGDRWVPVRNSQNREQQRDHQSAASEEVQSSD